MAYEFDPQTGKNIRNTDAPYVPFGTKASQAQRDRILAGCRRMSPSPPLLMISKRNSVVMAAAAAGPVLAHAVILVEDNMVAIHGMARISGLEDKPDEVEVWLNKAVSEAGQDWRNHHNLGRFYQQQGKLELAEKNAKKALSLAPKDSYETRLVLCEIYLDQGEATRALLEVERVIKIQATAKAWFLRGRAYFELESWKEAEDDFRRATLVDPQFHDARGAIGNVKIAQGDLEGAAQAFRSTLRFDPSNAAAQQNLKLVEKELAKRTRPPN